MPQSTVRIAMPTSDDTINVAMFALLDCTALLANFLLIVAIAKRLVTRTTPPNLRSYSVLILNTAIVDSFSAMFSLSAVARMQVVDGTLFFTPAGPCTLISAQFCHRSVFLQAALISHSTVLLFIAFCYRLRMLGQSAFNIFGQPRIRNVMLIAIIATAPSIVLYLLNDAAATYVNCPSDAVCSALHLWPITAENRLAPAAFGVLFSVYGVEFIAVFAARQALLKRIQKLKTPDRARHQMIFNSLTAQMLLPLTSVIGCVAFAVDFLGIVQSTWLQRSVILCGSTLALSAPIVNMYFLRPYRKFVVDLIGTGLRPQEDVLGSMVVDIFFQWVFDPVFLFPIFCMYRNAPLLNIPLSAADCVSMMMSLISGGGVVYFALFVYRHQSIAPNGSRFKFSLRTLLWFHAVILVPNIALGVSVSFGQMEFNDMSYEQERLSDDWGDEIKNRLSCFYLTKMELFHFWILLTFVPFFAVIFISTVAWHTFYLLNEIKNMSTKTRSLYKILTRSLVIQVLVPVVIIILPFVFVSILTTALLALAPSIMNEWAIDPWDCVILAISFHATTHSASLLLTTPAFRQKLAEMFSIGRKREESRVSPARDSTAFTAM